MFLRPRKFGKTLFTSSLEYYYDKNQSEKFDELFKNTYIVQRANEKIYIIIDEYDHFANE